MTGFWKFEDALIPMENWIETGVDWLVTNYRPQFQGLKWPVEKTLWGLDYILNWTHPLVIILLFALIAWRWVSIKMAIFSIFSLFLIGLLGMWSQTMTTLAMVLSAVFFCTVVGVPLGIIASQSRRFETWLRPVLDAMQTTPAFVYLVPVVMLFSIGSVAGVIATIIFSMPPVIRLTDLGIRQVPMELVEATRSFGGTRWQTLRKVQIPLAMPTIMAGLNQTIMLSLSMVVFAALIGAGGLGMPVFQGLNSLQVGLAGVGGLSIVLMAMVLDRITQAFGLPSKK